jgi:hypothetical protein
MTSSVTPPAAPELPDLYTPSAQLLSLLSIGNRALLSRKEDPLPQALAQLTDYDMAAVDRVHAVTDNASLYALLGEAPEVFADHLLLGRLVYASPLGLCLAAVVAADGSAPAEVLAQRRAEVQAFVAHNTTWFGQLIEDYMLTRYEEDDQAEVAQERADFRSRTEAAFADWQHTLGALALPAPAPVLPPLDAPGWSIQPMQVQLDTLILATSVLRSLPHLSQHPFAGAVQRLPDFHSQRIEELGDYLSAAVADERLRLNRAQGLLLYLAAHVTMLLFVSDVLDGEGLDDLLLRRHQQTPGGEEITTESMSRMREAVADILPGYIDVVRENEADAADFQALEARLGPVLALAAD